MGAFQNALFFNYFGASCALAAAAWRLRKLLITKMLAGLPPNRKFRPWTSRSARMGRSFRREWNRQGSARIFKAKCRYATGANWKAADGACLMGAKVR